MIAHTVAPTIGPLTADDLCSCRCDLLAFILAVVAMLQYSSSVASDLSVRPFSLSAEIGIARLGDRYQDRASRILFSPSGRYFAVYVERGRLESDDVLDRIAIYRVDDVKVLFDKKISSDTTVAPTWAIEANAKQGGAITDWRWIPNSEGIAFLRLENGGRTLALADVVTKEITSLSVPGESVKAFDIRDTANYVYTISARVPAGSVESEKPAIAQLATGQYLGDLLFPRNSLENDSRRSYLRAVLGGRRVPALKDGSPIVVYSDHLALAPAGGTVVTDIPVAVVPLSWESLYPPPRPGFAFRVRAGRQDPESPTSIAQYVLIDLHTNSITPLTGGPLSTQAGWFSGGSPKFSKRGTEVILPGTFLGTQADDRTTRPCVAVVSLIDLSAKCVDFLPTQPEEDSAADHKMVRDALFVNGDSNRAKLIYTNVTTSIIEQVVYERNTEQRWVPVAPPSALDLGPKNDVDVMVQEDFDSRPKVLAKVGGETRIILDPNPQLDAVEMGRVERYMWRDAHGRRWTGGLYLPPGYSSAVRYPIVLQTHGFPVEHFEPSGVYPTAMAARALAAAGIVVLQVNEDICPSSTEQEIACAVGGYEAAIKQLSSDNIVDIGNVGIIGFSRTCMYVMQALMSKRIAFKAASITDGVMVSYLQYLFAGDGADAVIQDADGVVGAQPFGVGLRRWVERSPTFNLHKVYTPLSITALGKISALWMWEPYAGLRRLHKPVDFTIIDTTEHVLTNPGARMASQGATLDWFRFWLQNYEDPDETKSDQYTRWRKWKSDRTHE